MKKLALLLGSAALVLVPAAASADVPAGCTGVKTVSIVNGKKVVTETISCPSDSPKPPVRGWGGSNRIDWD